LFLYFKLWMQINLLFKLKKTKNPSLMTKKKKKKKNTVLFF
jgi:hypothetical protein